MSTKAEKLVQELHKKGVLKMKEILYFGISKEYIRELIAKGLIERISRGYYRLPDYEYTAMQSIAEISKQVPKGVICLLSALRLHGLRPKILLKCGLPLIDDQGNLKSTEQQRFAMCGFLKRRLPLVSKRRKLTIKR